MIENKDKEIFSMNETIKKKNNMITDLTQKNDGLGRQNRELRQENDKLRRDIQKLKQVNIS